MNIETNPRPEQRRRLEDFIVELSIISRRYNMLLRTESSEIVVTDMITEKVVAIDVFWMFENPQETGAKKYRGAYLVSDSILDGVWEVDTPDGAREARQVGEVREERDQPPT